MKKTGTETLYVAQIVEDKTDKVVSESEPTYLRRAEKIEEGMGINLNWGKFSTQVVKAP